MSMTTGKYQLEFWCVGTSPAPLEELLKGIRETERPQWTSTNLLLRG